MTTPSRRAFVSLAVLTLTLAAGACVRARPMSAPVIEAVTVRFDNLSRERVHVYLIGLKRDWMLGRVEPGAVSSLRIPDPALAEGESFVRLAVIAGARATLTPSRHPGAKVTLAQPVSGIMAQQWRFSHGELIASSPPR